MGTGDGTLFETIEESEELQDDPVSDQIVEPEDKPVEPEPEEKPVDPVIEKEDLAKQEVLNSLDKLNESINQVNESIGQSLDSGVSPVDASGSYQWTYKGITNIAFEYGSVAYLEYFKNDDGSFAMASNGDLVASTNINLFEEFLFYRSGSVHPSGVRVFSTYPPLIDIEDQFVDASDGMIVHVDDLAIYERYLQQDEASLFTVERQEEQNEQVNEFLESIDTHLLHIEEMGFSDREDFQTIVTSSSLLLQDNETLGANLQVIYDSINGLNNHMQYMCIATTVNGFLIALGVGFLIAKLIIGRFK